MEIKDTAYIYKLIAGEKLAWHGRYHSHGEMEFEIHFFAEGEGTFFSNKTSCAIRNNSLFLVFPHEFHSILPKEVKKPLTYYAVLFSLEKSEENLRQLLMQAGRKKRQSLAESDSVSIKFMMEDIMRLSKAESADLRKSAALLLESCLLRWFGEQNGISQDSPVPRNSTAAKGYVGRAVKFMEGKVCKRCTVAELASFCGISQEHFIRIFKDEMQMTPHQYFTRLKIQTAALALINSRAPVSQIADDFSFENQFHFSRVFKKCTGLAPSAYRAAFTS
ncbi:AraC family transcriptional regulator [Treponema sp.]|uniref:AraC family transcriptional regulator n=1 Tax=Treponema sp. TaxID=166 RepID=UPI003F012C7F